MTRRAALLSVLLSLAALRPSRGAESWKAIEKVPGATPVPVLVEGADRAYFRVTPSAALTLSLRGPAQLRIVSRAVMPTAPASSADYLLRVREGKKVLERQRASTTVSTDARPKKGATRLGQSRQMIVRIPAGEHALALSVEGAHPVLVRLLGRKQAPWADKTVSLTPVEAFRTVSFKDNEKVIPYYSARPDKLVRFRIVGPVTVELVSRLDFDATMRGSQPYTLAVGVGDDKPRRVTLKTTKALTATYRDLNDRVPGKLRRTPVSVPEGTYVLTVGLAKPDGGSVEVQARIPEPQVGGQE